MKKCYNPSPCPKMEYYSPSNINDYSCMEMNDNKSYTKTHNLIRWKSGESVDPRLLALLESFGEIFVERCDFFKRIFDGKYEELFEKIENAFKKRKQMKKSRSMRRSLSMRAIGKRGIDEDALKLERFKVKTPNVIVVEQEDAPIIQNV